LPESKSTPPHPLFRLRSPSIRDVRRWRLASSSSMGGSTTTGDRSLLLLAPVPGMPNISMRVPNTFNSGTRLFLAKPKPIVYSQWLSRLHLWRRSRMGRFAFFTNHSASSSHLAEQGGEQPHAKLQGCRRPVLPRAVQPSTVSLYS